MLLAIWTAIITEWVLIAHANHNSFLCQYTILYCVLGCQPKNKSVNICLCFVAFCRWYCVFLTRCFFKNNNKKRIEKEFFKVTSNRIYIYYIAEIICGHQMKCGTFKWPADYSMDSLLCNWCILPIGTSYKYIFIVCCVQTWVEENDKIRVIFLLLFFLILINFKFIDSLIWFLEVEKIEPRVAWWDGVSPYHTKNSTNYHFIVKHNNVCDLVFMNLIFRHVCVWITFSTIFHNWPPLENEMKKAHIKLWHNWSVCVFFFVSFVCFPFQLKITSRTYSIA